MTGLSTQENFRYLNGRKLRVFLAAADTIIPPDVHKGVASPGGGTMQTASIVDWALDRMPPDLRKKLLVLLWVVEILGLFFGGRLFSNCSQKARTNLFTWMESSPIRLLRLGFFGLKNYVCMGYYSQDSTWQEMGYEGPLEIRPFAEPNIRDLCQNITEGQS